MIKYVKYTETHIRVYLDNCLIAVIKDGKVL